MAQVRNIVLALAVVFVAWWLFGPEHPPPEATISRDDHIFCTLIAVNTYPIDGGYSLVDELAVDKRRKGVLRECMANPNQYYEMLAEVRGALAEAQAYIQQEVQANSHQQRPTANATKTKD